MVIDFGAFSWGEKTRWTDDGGPKRAAFEPNGATFRGDENDGSKGMGDEIVAAVAVCGRWRGGTV